MCGRTLVFPGGGAFLERRIHLCKPMVDQSAWKILRFIRDLKEAKLGLVQFILYSDALTAYLCFSPLFISYTREVVLSLIPLSWLHLPRQSKLRQCVFYGALHQFVQWCNHYLAVAPPIWEAWGHFPSQYPHLPPNGNGTKVHSLHEQCALLTTPQFLLNPHFPRPPLLKPWLHLRSLEGVVFRTTIFISSITITVLYLKLGE